MLRGLSIAACVWTALAASPEERAVAYLAREVPSWFQENQCFSCHNNGDGARALYNARRRGYEVPAQSLANTTEWLARPRDWDNNRGDPGFSDKELARIQFASSLAAAFEAGAVADRNLLVEAAQSLVPYQEEDGSWRVDANADLGSPATYGAHLATCMARRVLQQADARRFAAQIARATDWLARSQPKANMDAAAAVIAMGAGRSREIALLRGNQASDGGWGPYRGLPSEAFDTALALLALKDVPEAEDNIQRGRDYLIRAQLAAGGWPETMRPPGARSYAQHISTSAWAALALMETRDKPE